MIVGGSESLCVFDTMIDKPFWNIQFDKVNDVAFNEQYMAVATGEWSIRVYDFS